MNHPVIEQWHQFIKTKNLACLDTLLAEDVTFYSPVVHTPQQGKALTSLYLLGAVATLGNQTFRYIREIYDDSFALLEFEVEMDEVIINGVDMISWNDAAQITEFKVMIRPLKAVNAVHQAMAKALSQMQDQL